MSIVDKVFPGRAQAKAEEKAVKERFKTVTQELGKEAEEALAACRAAADAEAIAKDAEARKAAK